MKALEVRARGYVVKGIRASGLIHAVQALGAGEVFVLPSLASTILFKMTHKKAPSPRSQHMSLRVFRQAVPSRLTVWPGRPD